jgi:hypothetical protein
MIPEAAGEPIGRIALAAFVKAGYPHQGFVFVLDEAIDTLAREVRHAIVRRLLDRRTSGEFAAELLAALQKQIDDGIWETVRRGSRCLVGTGGRRGAQPGCRRRQSLGGVGARHERSKRCLPCAGRHPYRVRLDGAGSRITLVEKFVHILRGICAQPWGGVRLGWFFRRGQNCKDRSQK